MTNKEAIELLKRATMFEPTLENRDYPEAFDLAIKALERPQGEQIAWEQGYECGKNESRPKGEITEGDIQNAIKAGYENGYSMAQAKYQRPQGEWINKRTIKHDGEFYCSNCDFELESFIQGAFYNFCPNCGMKMKMRTEAD